MIRTNFFIPEPLLKALRDLVKKTDMSAAEHVRRALADYLAKQN